MSSLGRQAVRLARCGTTTRYLRVGGRRGDLAQIVDPHELLIDDSSVSNGRPKRCGRRAAWTPFVDL